MAMTLGDLQSRIRELYGTKDATRGVEGTFMWFLEEVGELSGALRSGTREETILEFADVLAWLVTLAIARGSTSTTPSGVSTGRGAPAAAGRPAPAD